METQLQKDFGRNVREKKYGQKKLINKDVFFADECL